MKQVNNIERVGVAIRQRSAYMDKECCGDVRKYMFKNLAEHRGNVAEKRKIPT